MKTLALTALLIAALSPQPVFAHGGEKHVTTTAEIKREQKPWGIAGSPAQVSRTIEIVMSDTMRFAPDNIKIKLGETVKFTVRNGGGTMHEMVIGTKEELEAHAALMQKFPNMEHDEAYMAHVGPKQSGDIIWTFNRAGDFEFACLIPGHFSAGMKGVIQVAADSLSWSAGEVRRIDVANRKITLKHGEIRNLDMPPMTMVFRATDGVRLEDFKVGDAIQFVAEKEGGRYLVRQIKAAE